MASQAIIITGDAELDAKMAKLEPKLQAKHIRKATRAGAKKVLARARSLTPQETGTMAAAMKVRAVSRTIKGATGKQKRVTTKAGRSVVVNVKKTVAKEFGARVVIDRKALAKQAGKRGKKLSEDSKRGEPFFYPAAVELGTKKKTADSPMRRGMKAAESEALAEFRTELRKFAMNPT